MTSQFAREYDRCVEELGSACIQADPVQEWRSNVYDGRGVRVLSTRNIISLGGVIGIEEPQPDLYFYTPELTMLNIVTATRNADVIWFGSRPVADHGEGGVRYTFTDHLGTPILQTTATAAVTWRAEYEPFGNVYALRAGSTSEDQPLRFPGQQLAFRTLAGEENYNIFRWYRSGWGRYTQVDPIGVGGQGHFDARSGSMRTFNAVDVERGATVGASAAELQANPFGYAFSSPLRYVDRLGLWPCVVFSVNSTAEYMLQTSGLLGSTMKGCVFTGVCGTPDYQYLAIYEREKTIGCKCPTFCIFQIDLVSGVRTTPGTCFDIPWPSLGLAPPLIGPS